MKRLRRWMFKIMMILFFWVSCFSTQARADAKVYEYYRSKLTGTDLKVYDAMKKAWLNGEEAVEPVKIGDHITQYWSIGKMVLDDHPECFWISGAAGMIFNDELYCSGIPAWEGAYRQRASFEKSVNKVVKSLKKKCAGKSATKKAALIHDYICKSCRYRRSGYDQTAFGVFSKKNAVCAGYARAFKLLCDRLGVKCICISGYVTSWNGAGGPHMVNYVKIGKKWYYVDCTWDDRNGNQAPVKTYFLIGGTFTKGLTTCNGVKVPQISKKTYSRGKR